MPYSKTGLLDKAIEIVIAYAGSASQTTPLEVVLEDVYKKLEELNNEANE